MSDGRITIAYTLHYFSAEAAAVKKMIEALRIKAIDLGFQGVSGLTFLQGSAEIISHEYGERFLVADLETVPAIPKIVCYFTASLFDSEHPFEIGLERLPFGLPDWTWTAATRSRDLRTFSLLMDHAAELGMLASMSFGGMTITCYRDDSGAVKYAQEWNVRPDDFWWDTSSWKQEFR